MLVYKTTGNDVTTRAFLAELRIQILISKRAYNVLYNNHLYVSGDLSATTYSSIEMIENFSLFLNSIAFINKILGLSKRYNKPRAKKLRKMINIQENEIVELREVDLRNSMEHMDERLDEIEKQVPQEIVNWNFVKYNSLSKYTLRRFDPKAFKLQCIKGDLSISDLDIRKCYEEILLIEKSLNESFSQGAGLEF